MADTGSDAGQPIDRFKFDGREIKPVDGYSELQRAVLPVIGIRADGVVEDLGTAFCVCFDPPVLLTARHVVDSFIDTHRADLMSGRASTRVVWETDEKNPDGVTDLGGALPLYRAVYYRPSMVSPKDAWLGPPDESERRFNSDIAVLIPFGVVSGDRPVGPSPTGPLDFLLPSLAAWAYAVGYPEMTGEVGLLEDGKPVINWTRTPKVSGGLVEESYCDGQPGNSLVQGPSFDMDLELPHGMSGGPILSDGLGICAVASAAVDPHNPDDRWASYATGLAPALDLPLLETLDDTTLTLRVLIFGGAVVTTGPLPPNAPAISTATTVTFPKPPAPGSE